MRGIKEETMRKPATIATIVAVLIASAVVLGFAPVADAHLGHSISVNDVTVNEGASTAAFTLTVTPAPEAGETVKVDVATANGSAVGVASCPTGTSSASADYARVAKTTITFAAGESTKQRTVQICPDTAPEGDETFFLNLTDPAFTCEAPCAASSASIGDFQGVATIADDEAAPALQITDAAAVDEPSPEGAVATMNFTFDVTLSAATNKTVTVQYATSNGTASAGSDYIAKSGTLTFAPGSTAPQTISIAVIGDTTSELDETFFVDLSSPTNATIGDPRGIAIIENDDAPATGTNAFNINDVTRNEGDTGNAPATPFTFTVTLGRGPLAGQIATVNYHVAEGTAAVGSDYVFANGTLTFEANQTAQTITVPVLGDVNTEGNETFNVNLSGADCAPPTVCDTPAISDPQGRGTINNDDGSQPGPINIVPVLKVGGYFQARVTADAPCAANRTIKIKQSVPGTDTVRASGTTDSNGVFKQAVRPKKRGQFYAQVYDVRRQGSSGEVICKGGKSPVRTLPA
jgi:hypothetical protein